MADEILECDISKPRRVYSHPVFSCDHFGEVHGVSPAADFLNECIEFFKSIMCQRIVISISVDVFIILIRKPHGTGRNKPRPLSDPLSCLTPGFVILGVTR